MATPAETHQHQQQLQQQEEEENQPQTAEVPSSAATAAGLRGPGVSRKLEKKFRRFVRKSLAWHSQPVYRVSQIRQRIQWAGDDVKKDKNCRSWYALGFAYLTLYFATDWSPSVLAQALEAFSNAENCGGMEEDAMFHFVRGFALIYQRDYTEAFKCLEKASACCPEWDIPVKYLNDLRQILEIVPHVIENKGYATSETLSDMIQNYMFEDLGPYQTHVNVCGADGNITSVLMWYTPIGCLQEGLNKNKTVLGKVVYMSVTRTSTILFLVEYRRCFAVNVYRLAKDKFVNVGDSVAIPNPYLETVRCTYKEKEYTFQWICVQDPLCLVINRSLVQEDWIAQGIFLPTYISYICKDDSSLQEYL